MASTREDPVAALTDRLSARARIQAAFLAQLDRLIPTDPTLPLRGGLFIEWELQADQLANTLASSFVEERAALAEDAEQSKGGRCPHCGSDRVYLIPGLHKTEVLTPHGVIVLSKQRCRCRSCDRAFSPSSAGLGPERGEGIESGR
jgi:hypothetical protein